MPNALMYIGRTEYNSSLKPRAFIDNEVVNKTFSESSYTGDFLGYITIDLSLGNSDTVMPPGYNKLTAIYLGT